MPWTLAWPEVAVLDANAVALGTPVAALMEAAGGAVADVAAGMLADVNATVYGVDASVWILCGPGNNGGDGWVAAEGLGSTSLDVRVLASHRAQKGLEAQTMRERAIASGIPVHEWAGQDWEPSLPDDGPDLFVDALLGVGPGGPGGRPRGALGEVIADVRSRLGDGRVLAVDVPTGLGSEQVLPASRTVTFHAPKAGMLDDSACGAITVVPLPWPAEVEDVGPGELERWPGLDPSHHKGQRGRVLVVGGGPYHGAPLLAGLAALRSGCDLVQVAMPRAAASRVRWPLELMPLAIDDEEVFGPGLAAATGDGLAARTWDAIVLGPGAGLAPSTTEALRQLLAAAAIAGVPVAVDADGLAALPEGTWPDGLRGVATPHRAERARWLGDRSPAAVLAARPDDDESVVILTTGPVDELVGPGGRVARARGGSPRMATGGTGDLLAGTIGGLLAQGMAAWPAARLASWLLRRAGELAVAAHGPGLLASDVPPYLSTALLARRNE